MYYFKNGHRLLKPCLELIGNKTFTIPKPSNSIILIKKNNTFEYQEVKQNHVYKACKFRVYDSDLFNVTHYFITNPNITTTWYCTVNRFDLIQAKYFKKENQYTKYLKTHKFQILNTYLDQHPLDCYVKLCNLVNLKASNANMKIYSLSFGQKSLKIDTVFYKPINKLNKIVLQQQQIKSKELKRIKFIQPLSSLQLQQRQQIMKKWNNNLIGFNIVSKENYQKSLNEMVNNELYTQYSYQQYLKQCKPKLQSFAPIIY